MHYKNPYDNEWKVKGRPGFLEIFAYILKNDNRIDDYDFFQKLFINFSFSYTLNNETIKSLLNILEYSDNTNIIKIVIGMLHQYIISNEKNKKILFENGLLDTCIFRLLNKDTEDYFIELIDLIKDVNIPNELTKLQCLIYSRLFETCFDIYRSDTLKINKLFECFNTFLESEFFVYTFTKENSIYPLLRFLNPLLKGVSPETVANVLNSINAMIKYRVILEDLTKTPIVKYLLHQILNKDFDVTKASYKLLLRVSNNESMVNDFLKEWGSLHISSVMKNKNIDLLYPVALLVKKLLIKGKLNKKNDKIHSEVILKQFNTMREERRKETGNETEYSIVNKKLENKISEFHPVVYNLDNLEGTIEIPNIRNEIIEDVDEDDNEEIELLSSDDNIKKNNLEEEKENKEKEEEEKKEKEKIELARLMELEKQKEELKETHRENMLKKYNIDRNEKVITYEEMGDVNVDDEWNKINKNNNVNLKDLMGEEKNLNEKMMEIRNKILDKGNKINSKKMEKEKNDIKEADNEIPSNVNPEEFKTKLENFNKFMSDNTVKHEKKKKNDYTINNKNDINPDGVKSMCEMKDNDPLLDETEILFKNLSDGNINDYFLNDSICDLRTLTEGNENDNNISTDNKSIVDIKTTNNKSSNNERHKLKPKPIFTLKSLKSHETIQTLLSKIRSLISNTDLNNNELVNINKFLKDEEFKTNKIEKKDEVGYVIHKEILYEFNTDMKIIQEAIINDENKEKLTESMFGADLDKANFLEVYKSKLINDLYNLEVMSNLEYSYLEYLTKETKNNSEYTANRSSILDLFEEDSDVDDDLFNKCISALKYITSENKANNKKQKSNNIDKKREQFKLFRKRNKEKKIKKIKNKKKRIYGEYEKGIQKRNPHKEIEEKNKEFLDKNFSDISLDKDIKPIEEMTDEFLYQKVKEYGSAIFKSQSIGGSSQEIPLDELTLEILQTDNESFHLIQDDSVDNNIIKALNKFNAYNEKLKNIDFIMTSVLNELQNSKLFHEKINILYKLQELSLFKKNISEFYLQKLINEILIYINDNDNKVILRLCYNIILNLIKNDKYKVIIGTNVNLFKYINNGLQTYDIKIIEIAVEIIYIYSKDDMYTDRLIDAGVLESLVILRHHVSNGTILKLSQDAFKLLVNRGGDRAKNMAKFLLSNPWEKVYQVWLLAEDDKIMKETSTSEQNFASSSTINLLF